MPANDLLGALKAQGVKDRSYPYHTPLSPEEEDQFFQWINQNKIPFNPGPRSDYDMKGFFKGLLSGDPEAHSGINQTTGTLHFPDKWKTPHHESFSGESMYAPANAPRWKGNKLVDHEGNTIRLDLPEDGND